jgi:integrase
MQCDFSYKKELPDIFPDLFKKLPQQISQNARAVAQNPAEEGGYLLSEVIQRYVAENAKRKWTEKSKQENESSLYLFLEVMGDVPVKSINRRQISEFKAVLRKLPPFRNNVKEYRDKSIQQLTEEELEKLMRSEEYINDSHRRSYQFWTPIIALFTGMRQNEIAQLHLDDIRKNEEGVWLIDVNDRGDKKVKTKSARRRKRCNAGCLY